MRWLETVLSCIPTEQAPKKVRGTKFPDCRVSSSLAHEKKQPSGLFFPGKGMTSRTDWSVWPALASVQEGNAGWHF